VNCVLSNPFYREKVIQSHLIKKRITAIADRQILMDQFLGVFQKSFCYSSITKYHYPVKKCSIIIGIEDQIEMEWIHKLKDLFMLSNDNVHINTSVFDNGACVKVDYQEEDLYSVVIHNYIRFFLCCIIFDITEEVYGECRTPSGKCKKVLVLQSLQAKEYSMNKLKEYAEYIKQTSLYCFENIYTNLNERISYEIGDIEEQCGSMRLDLNFKNHDPDYKGDKANRIYDIRWYIPHPS
jgi:hypothetical protein